jgi:hypothetical protein
MAYGHHGHCYLGTVQHLCTLSTRFSSDPAASNELKNAIIVWRFWGLAVLQWPDGNSMYIVPALSDLTRYRPLAV